VSDNERCLSIFLERTKFNTNELRRRAENLGRYVRLMTTTPPYNPAAADALSDAENALTETLLAVKLARREYAATQPLIAAE
jgi:hypothetical protein